MSAESKQNGIDHDHSSNLPSFDECMRECDDLFKLGVRSNFNEAIDRVGKWSSASVYNADAHMVLSCIKHMLSFEKSDIEMSMKLGKNILDLCDKNRKTQSIVSSFWNFFGKTDYNDYTDHQIHSLALKANGLFMYGGTTFVSDNNLMTMVKGAFRLQAGFSLINKCADILDRRTNWESIESKNFFKIIVLWNQAFVSLLLSHLPNRVMTFLSMIGFDCDREKAIDTMKTLIKSEFGYYSIVTSLGLILYECVIVPIFGSRPPDTDLVIEIVNRELDICDHSSWALLGKALALKLSGDIDGAINHYKRSIDSQKDFKQLHVICHWDLSFCYGLKMQWNQAVEHAEILIDICNWSKATVTYMKAAFLYMKMVDEDRPELKNEISNLLRLVPQLKQRFSGKTIPPEKYVCVNAEKYFKQNNSLALPAFDLFYIWNIYAYATSNPTILDPIINKIDEHLPNYNEKNQLEDYCLLQLMKGICLKYQNRYENAENCFQEIFNNESDLEDNRNLLAMTSLEMGLTKLNAKSYSEAEVWLKKAEKYKKYFFKSMIHFRAHSALQVINQFKQD